MNTLPPEFREFLLKNEEIVSINTYTYLAKMEREDFDNPQVLNATNPSMFRHLYRNVQNPPNQILG